MSGWIVKDGRGKKCDNGRIATTSARSSIRLQQSHKIVQILLSVLAMRLLYREEHSTNGYRTDTLTDAITSTAQAIVEVR